MKENQYYMTTAEIYWLPRKSFIYVYKVCNKVFFYNYIHDWQLVEVNKETILKINKVESPNYRGKLIDADNFKLLKRERLIL